MTHSTCDLSDRSPAVAGMFYPGDPGSIEQTLEQWSGEAAVERRPWRAALVPHAGWLFSGRIAAAVFSRIQMPSTIVLLCPKHRPGGVECAIAPWKRWLFPGGSVETDVSLSQQLADAVPGLELDDRPHRHEHAIEVQLPMLAKFAPESKIVGITVGQIGWTQCEAIARDAAEVLRDRLDNVLLVVSSDLNHFADDAENRRLDELAMRALDQLDPRTLHETCRRHRITMCGMLPCVIVLLALQQLNALQRAVRVDYTTSAEATGDTNQVVGYAGMLFG
ncbi:MAG: AmmeMemoRadiSam system protein B [Planctomycetota bacterium]